MIKAGTAKHSPLSMPRAKSATTSMAARSKAGPRKPKSPSAWPKGARAKIRMYRQGLGDFFLVTLPRAGAKDFHMLIDCGVITGTPDGKANMQRLVKNLAAETGGLIDVVVATHRHADHISGFLQAAEIFKTLQIGEVWMSWIENPADKLGQQVLSTHKNAEKALRAAAAKLRVMGMDAAGDEVANLLGFRDVGLAGDTIGTTDQAVEIAKTLGSLRFCRPDDPPRRPGGVAANIFVLGPPRDIAALAKMNPSKVDPETYGISAMQNLLHDIAPALGVTMDDGGGDSGNGNPFGPNWAIPLKEKDAPSFFQANYFEEDSHWRRIDEDWFMGASALALAFDDAVNNTSLVLAIQLDGGDVLVFAADAQVGNWLSWQQLKWKLSGGSEISGPDLLGHAVFYKVGHHASHNGTLEAQGLELMRNIQFAMISVDEQMALKKNWGQMPFPKLMEALNKHTAQRAIRSDKDVPEAAKAKVRSAPDYYELTI
jgi:beta-lactamase superfamily II metal-dependent hydrolase